MLVNIADSPVGFQISVGLRIGKTESSTEFVDKGNDVFYLVADRIGSFHNAMFFYGCKL